MKERIVSDGHVLIYITNDRGSQIEYLDWHRERFLGLRTGRSKVKTSIASQSR